MGQLTASIAHEVNQPIAAVVTNAQAALRWLNMQPPELEEVRQAPDRILKAGRRAGDVISRMHALVRKAPPRKDPLDINEVIREVIALARSELHRTGTALQTQLADDLSPVPGDRIQLQQVMLNLILNAVEAMSGSAEGWRELLISTEADGASGVCVAVRDWGPGLKPESLDRLFDAFYTTKPDGMEMGLSICPFDRGPWWTSVGRAKRTPGGSPSVHPASARGDCVVNRHPPQGDECLYSSPIICAARRVDDSDDYEVDQFREMVAKNLVTPPEAGAHVGIDPGLQGCEGIDSDAFFGCLPGEGRDPLPHQIERFQEVASTCQSRRARAAVTWGPAFAGVTINDRDR